MLAMSNAAMTVAYFDSAHADDMARFDIQTLPGERVQIVMEAALSEEPGTASYV